MLQLAGGEAFGVDVADLFEFKRAFKGNREPNVAPEEDHRRGIFHLVAKFFHKGIVVDNLLDLSGHLLQLTEDGRDFILVLVAAKLRKIQTQQICCSNLRQKRLGRCDRNLGTSVGVQRRIGFTRQG